MNEKRILFLGGSYAQIPIIKEAKKRGWYIITCDYLPDNPGHKLANEYYNVSTTDINGVLNLAKKVNPDFVVAYASDPAAPVAAYVSEKLGLPGNPYESVQILSNKDLFRNFLKRNGFNAPKFIIATDTDVTTTEKIRDLQFPVIVKPTDSSGSKGITKIEKISDFNNAFKYALKFSRNKRVIVEEFIESNGSQLHGDGFVHNGKLIFSYLGDHHYDIQINPFVPCSTTWPSKKSKSEIKKVEKELEKVINLSGFKNGAINIEVRLNSKGDIYIMEIGPRSGGNFVPQVINYATGFDMVKATLDVINGQKINPIHLTEKAAAYYVVHSDKNGILQNLEIKNEIKPYIKEYHQYIQPGEKVKPFKGANAAIGILLLSFNTIEEMDYYISNINNFISLQITSE